MRRKDRKQNMLLYKSKNKYDIKHENNFFVKIL